MSSFNSENDLDLKKKCKEHEISPNNECNGEDHDVDSVSSDVDIGDNLESGKSHNSIDEEFVCLSEVFDSDNSVQDLSPSDIVKELDRYIIGQSDAKRAVAVALRNRWRRNKVPQPLRDEIIPKNILMIGHTGVGKTEIARRLAKLASAPFIKIEATKFTEIGYVGRDVDSIVRDLVDVAVALVKEKCRKTVVEKARYLSEKIILKALVGPNAGKETQGSFMNKLKNGDFEEFEIEISVRDNRTSASSFEIPGIPGMQLGIMNLGEMMSKMLGGNKALKTIKVKVKDAREILIEEESEKLMDEDKIIKEALHISANYGIVFLDEIDKITSRSEVRESSGVNKEGVQRDLLPLLEGTSVNTKYGVVKTDHVLFIASGAFHLSKPSDLLPELQGRLPIRVELKPLTKDDLIKILKEPESSLLKQYCALMETEQVTINFTDDGVAAIADIASDVNREVENIGARRLHTILEKLMEDISYSASENRGKTYVIDRNHVDEKLKGISKQLDLSKSIL